MLTMQVIYHRWYVTDIFHMIKIYQALPLCFYILQAMDGGKAWEQGCPS